jgi:peptidoglycan/LPS O-acetylase OafA/YrhL
MSTDGRPHHLRGLDSLRAVAFSFVLLDHFLPGEQSWKPWINGHVGVHLFFVISGLLITGILLDARTALEQTCGRGAGVVGRFYARRVLRIFPVFYATLALTYVAGFPIVRQSIWWHVTYASNIYFFKRGAFAGQVSHFWSLAVEEQFYLFWPFVILFTPRRHLGRVMTFCIVFSSAFRIAGQLIWNWNDVQREMLTFSCLDSLAIGGLFAWWQRSAPEHAERLAGLLFRVVLPVWIVTTAISAYGLPSIEWVFRPLDALALGGVVFAVAAGRFKFVLHRQVLVYLGRISYGMYVFHLFVALCVRTVLRVVFHVEHLPNALLVTLYTAVTIAAAAVSWHFFEAPLNSLKRFFPYVRDERVFAADSMQTAGTATIAEE